jgi:hypothetical protein
MTNAGRPRPLPPDHPTRRQLDELDALMQRMLALPVNSPDPAPPANEKSQSATAPEGMTPKTEVQDRAGPAASKPSAARSTEALPRPGPALQSSPAPRRPSEASVPEPVLASAVAVERSVELAERPRAEQSAGKERLLIARPLLPLWWTNRFFDACMAGLGDPGRWLAGAKGRSLLGWTGLVLLLAALSWIALERFDWIW